MNSSAAKTKKLVILAMFCAMAYVLMAVGRIPIVLFLKYDPKDIIITIAGFLFGAPSALAVSFVVSLIEMLTLSDTGIIGFFMNVLSTASFACTAAVFYKRHHNLKGAIMGLIIGSVAMVVVMLLWNYLITPLYMGVSRQDVAALILPAFLPFNLIKGVLNAAITMLIYKPVVGTLTRMHLVEPHKGSAGMNAVDKITYIAICLFVLATCVLCFLVLAGKI
jgi:riboflavin transporter FmnP